MFKKGLQGLKEMVREYDLSVVLWTASDCIAYLKGKGAVLVVTVNSW